MDGTERHDGAGVDFHGGVGRVFIIIAELAGGVNEGDDDDANSVRVTGKDEESDKKEGQSVGVLYPPGIITTPRSRQVWRLFLPLLIQSAR